MSRKVVTILLLVAVLCVLWGCTANNSAYKPVNTMRRGAIMAEEWRLMQEDIDRLFDIEDMPTNSRWTQ